MNIRPIYVEECALCGEEHDKLFMQERFTGRMQYICPACAASGERQISARRKEWRSTYKGKQVISYCSKNK